MSGVSKKLGGIFARDFPNSTPRQKLVHPKIAKNNLKNPYKTIDYNNPG